MTGGRPWYQFSLRTMFVGMVLASVAFSYWVHWSREWIRKREEMLADGLVWDASFLSFNARPMAPAGLWLFGERGVTVVGCSPIDCLHEHKERARQLFPEAELW